MRIGLIGAGAVADFHVAAARAIDGASITAVCDIDEKAAERAAATAPRATAFTDYRAMYASGLIDGVVVNTPHALHLPMVTEAARAGLHVLVEKPMATTLEDCDAMMAACVEADVALAVGHIQHFMPDKLAARDLIETAELGDVVLIRTIAAPTIGPAHGQDGSSPPRWQAEALSSTLADTASTAASGLAGGEPSRCSPRQ